MFAIYGQLDLAGVAVRPRDASLGRRAACVRCRRLARVLPGPLPRTLLRALRRAFAGALLLRRRGLPAPAARPAQSPGRAAALPRVLARAGTALAALAAVAGVGSRLDPVVSASHLGPQLRALPEFRGRLLPYAAVVPLAPSRRVVGTAASAPVRLHPP